MSWNEPLEPMTVTVWIADVLMPSPVAFCVLRTPALIETLPVYVLAAVSAMAPGPILVRVGGFGFGIGLALVTGGSWMVPLMVRRDAASAFRVVLESRVIVASHVLWPLTLWSAPAPTKPAPFRVSSSSTAMLAPECVGSPSTS